MFTNEPISSIEPVKGRDLQTEDKFEEALLHHVKRAEEAALNRQWDDVEYHFNQAEALAADMPEQLKNLSTQMIKILAIIFDVVKQGVEHEDSGEKDLAETTDKLRQAKDLLRSLMTNYRQPELVGPMLTMAVVLNSQISNTELAIAKRRGDTRQIALLTAQQQNFYADFVKMLGPEDPLRYLFEALLLMPKVRQPAESGMRAVRELALEDANRYLAEAEPIIGQIEAYLNKAPTGFFNVVTKGTVKAYSLLVNSQREYSHVLHSAIIGNVTQEQVKMLEEGDKQMRESVALLEKYLPTFPRFREEDLLGLKSFFEDQRKMMGNLRRMCERSLTVKEISRAAFPRVIVFFLVTFLILLFALPLSGLISELNFSALAFIIFVAFVASLIASFGFESLRLLPWFEGLGSIFKRILGLNREAAKNKAAG